MTTPTLDYLLRLAMRERFIMAKAIVEDNCHSPAWGEAQAAVKELLDAGAKERPNCLNT